MNAEAREGEWDAGEAEQRLLDFVASLILDLAHTHPRITEVQIVRWLARVALGNGR
jgi:hypothetical protein